MKVAIIGLVILFIKWNSSKNNDENNNKDSIISNDNNDTKVNDDDNNVNDNSYREIKYKKFTFNLPSYISFSEVDDRKFKLTTNDYEAIVEIYIDSNSNTFNKKDIYYNTMLDNGLNVDKYYEKNIDDTNAIIYNKHADKNSLLCYFKAYGPYAIEVELYNKDNSFKTDYLSELKNILLYYIYDSKSKDKFTYYSMDLDSIYQD